MPCLLGLGIGAGALSLLLHRCPEASLINAQTCLCSHFQGEVDREAVRVVEREGIIPREQIRSALLEVRAHALENLRAVGECATEGIFFRVQNLFDLRELLLENGIRRHHGVLRDWQQLRQRLLIKPK